MTDIEREERRAAKAEVAEELPHIFGQYRGVLEDADPRLWGYVEGVCTNAAAHNVFELLAVRRFLKFLDRYEFKRNKFRRVRTCLEMLKFPSDKGMTTLRLTPVQVFAVAGIYGFYNGRRRCTRNAMLFVPRKFGKTTIVAGLAEYELIFGPADGQTYACANSYQQAKICFDNIRRSLAVIDPSRQNFVINREAIYSTIPGRPAFAKCLASDPTTLDGLNASLYILDEFSQSKSAELRNVMATSQGTRENPLEIIITTASSLQEGPCADTLKAYENILLGKAEDDNVFALIFQPDVDDDESDPATWAKVQPHLGITVKPDYYEQAWKKAQLTSADMLAFRTKLLNVFATDEEKRWILADEVRDLFDETSIPDRAMWQRPPMTTVAFDLSVWDDFSAVCYAMYDSALRRFKFYLEYYIPEDTVDRHPYRDIYRQWIRDGYLTALPGKTIDYGLIVNDILSKNGPVMLVQIGYDPYKSKDAVNMLKSSVAARILTPCKQTYGSFTGAVETLEAMIKDKKCSFNPNPITAWCFGNCLMDEDTHGNRKPVKASQQMKIDGAVCALMCVNLFSSLKK